MRGQNFSGDLSASHLMAVKSDRAFIRRCHRRHIIFGESRVVDEYVQQEMSFCALII